MKTDYATYLSPFTWRYGSPEMRHIWSEAHKRCLWRKIWVILAEVQAEFGIVQPEQLAELRAHADDIDIERSLAIEAEIHHDLMAELKTFAEQAPLGGKVLHLGATSTDIEDNADVLRLRESLDLVIEKLRSLLLTFASLIEKYAELPLIAFTHLQPAEPSSLGYRLSQYAQDLLSDWMNIRRVFLDLRAKGFRGAVGTAASYTELIGSENLPKFEAMVAERLGLQFFTVVTQVYPRRQDYQIISALAGLGGSLYKLAFDLRILQSPPFGELSEPFGAKQVGSSAMPFKRNPIQAEKVNSLARTLAQMPRLAWDNAAHSLLERTLDDSANRRSLLAEGFLIADELLLVARKILEGLQVDERAINHNLKLYGSFAAIERVLMALGKAGADRQEMHQRLRKHALVAWEAVREAKPYSLLRGLLTDEVIREYLSEKQLRNLMDVRRYLGDAPQRACRLAADIRQTLQER